MRRQVRIFAGFAGTLILIAAAASCGDSTTAPANKRYIANLNAAAEGGTVTSAGSGVVTFEDKGDLITWSMTLTNMTNVTVSHIHLGDATRVGATAGPVIFNLFLPNRAPGNEIGTVNGLVAEGTITNANSPTVKLDSLRVLFNNGNAYANVHTAANPGGEIRDQIHPVN
ncbi:MAG: CHRD domain-containing protein [Gemmatimonadales bacterium]